jgi:hypothetical protein
MSAKPTIRWDASALALILANMITLIYALLGHWNLSELMWVYWGQSLIIGFFCWCRILCLKQFSTDGVEFNDQPVPPTRETQYKAASFFAVHYGFFHVIYFGFLVIERADLSRPEIIGVVVCVAVFAINHAFSFWHNLARDVARTPNIGYVMLFPYARIIPMHLTIILGGIFFAKQSQRALILFMVLKTFADLVMHLMEHWQGDQPTSPTCDV